MVRFNRFVSNTKYRRLIKFIDRFLCAEEIGFRFRQRKCLVTGLNFENL